MIRMLKVEINVNEKIISERISGGFSTFPGEISVKKHMFERSEFVLFRK